MSTTIKRPYGEFPRNTIEDVLGNANIPSWSVMTWLNQVQQHSYIIEVFEVDHDVPSCAANTTTDTDITVTGIDINDHILRVEKPSTSAGLGIVNYRVSAADTVKVTFMNTTGAAIDPASETYKIIVLRG